MKGRVASLRESLFAGGGGQGAFCIKHFCSKQSDVNFVQTQYTEQSIHEQQLSADCIRAFGRRSFDHVILMATFFKNVDREIRQ